MGMGNDEKTRIDCGVMGSLERVCLGATDAATHSYDHCGQIVEYSG